MIDIFVMRGDGDRRGDDITSPLLCSLSAALQRGQVEIDLSTPARSVQLSAKYRAGLKTGQLVRVIDALQGVAWQGKITSIDNGMQGVKLMSHLTIHRVI